MDLLRQLWRRIGPADPRAKLFEIKPAVDPIPLLPLCIIPELRRIITEYATDFVYKWKHDVPSYVRVAIRENHLICRTFLASNSRVDSWFRIVASQSVRQGSYRWRIIAQFTEFCAGCVAVGVSRTTPAYGTRKKLREGATAGEILVWTSECATLALDDERQARAHIFQNYEWKASEHSRWRASAPTLNTVLLVECDLERHLLKRHISRCLFYDSGYFDSAGKFR